MSTSVDVIRNLYAAFHARDADAMRALACEDSEFRSALASIEGRVYRGPEGGVAYMEDIDAHFEEWTVEDERYEAGDDCVLVTYRVRAMGVGGRVPVDTELAAVWTVRDGKALHGKVYVDLAEARAAAGLQQ